MGEHESQKSTDPEERRRFMRRVLDDLAALERMLAEDRFETGVARIGAEQEMFLIDRHFQPAPRSTEVLAAIDDPHFTTELARFNLEANLDPLSLEPHCLARLEADLDRILEQARAGARSLGTEILLTGILPTLEKADLSLDNMTPVPRYFALADAMAELRGREFEFSVRGRDELKLTHDTVMLESCNTSFQIHFQVDPDRFARVYNVAQALAAPTLAAATNSPLFFGKRLWAETRIALFRQSVDTRRQISHRRRQSARVAFGEHWIEDSVVEIFREDLARFRLLLTTEVDEDPAAMLARGEAPSLRALRLHNGTVYRWNRPCYGILDGRPHLRIENRILPSGPTVIDEVANVALWLGAIKALGEEVEDIRPRLEFDAARENFLAASRFGLKAQFQWLDGRSLTAQELVCAELVPYARRGLDALGIAAEDRDRYLGIIEERVESRRTGSQWLLDSFAQTAGTGSDRERLAYLTEALFERQLEGDPVHTWALARPRRSRAGKAHLARVESLMSTDLFTVNENEIIDLVASLMDWKHIRHVPVEDDEHRLVGLMSHRILLRVLAHKRGDEDRPIAVRDVMQRDVVTVEPQTPTLEAIELMKKHRIACLPVVEDGHLVGILTERDLIRISRELLEDFLRDA